MKLLLLGGPRFLGRAVADAALARGHELTFFNRGQTNPELYPEAEKLRGDRTGDLGALSGRTWDAVIDTCGYLPRVVRVSAKALADSGRYCFISTISVYADFRGPVDEDSPLARLDDLPTDEVTNDSYGPLKALCETAVLEELGEMTDEFLIEHEVGEWMELPLWIADPAMTGADDVDVRRAVATGLKFRPVADTIRGTLEEAQPTDAAGLSVEREAALLAEWHAR